MPALLVRLQELQMSLLVQRLADSGEMVCMPAAVSRRYVHPRWWSIARLRLLAISGVGSEGVTA